MMKHPMAGARIIARNICWNLFLTIPFRFRPRERLPQMPHFFALTQAAARGRTEGGAKCESSRRRQNRFYNLTLHSTSLAVTWPEKVSELWGVLLLSCEN